MSPLTKLAGYALVLLVALVVGLGVGSAVGPIDVGGDADHDEAPVHEPAVHGGAS